MISYAGVPLGHPTPEIAAWVAQNVSTEDCFPFAPLNDQGLGLEQLPYRPQTPPAPVRVGRLYWPWGASRFATAHYLCTDADLARVRAYCYPTADGMREAPLVIDTGNGQSVTATMWMLPPRPLAAVTPGHELWLLTLVDDRWRWWWRAASVAGQSTWAALYSAIGTALGVTITADAVPAAYLTPPPEMAASYAALPLLLDAVAMSVGQRVVRGFDGSVRAISPAAGRALWLAQAEAYAGRMLAGGEIQV